MARFQRGYLRREPRKSGDVWVYRYNVTHPTNGRRVEHTATLGALREFPNRSAAWAEVERRQLIKTINQPDYCGRKTFEEVARHYSHKELDGSEKSSGTIYCYSHILDDYLIPRWGDRVAAEIKPVEIEDWFKWLNREKELEWPTIDKMRRVMSLVYAHGQRLGLIPRGEESNPFNVVRCKCGSDYEAQICTPEQTFAILCQLEQPENTLTLLIAATGIRISECLGLQWQDVDYGKNCIHIRRTWIDGVGQPKTRASKAPVPMHPLLAECLTEWHQRSLYTKPTDWVFASEKLHGEKPRVGNGLVADYLRPAAVKAGVNVSPGQRFGFHNLRHSLASFLVTNGTDPKTVQRLLRHANVHTTLQVYAHAVGQKQMEAQEAVLKAILKPASGAVQ